MLNVKVSTHPTTQRHSEEDTGLRSHPNAEVATVATEAFPNLFQQSAYPSQHKPSHHPPAAEGEPPIQFSEIAGAAKIPTKAQSRFPAQTMPVFQVVLSLPLPLPLPFPFGGGLLLDVVYRVLEHAIQLKITVDIPTDLLVQLAGTLGQVLSSDTVLKVAALLAVATITYTMMVSTRLQSQSSHRCDRGRE